VNFKILRLVVLFLMISTGVITMSANRAGKYGSYQAGCTNCHGNNASGNTAVSLTGPLTVKTGSTNNYSFNVGHGVNNYAGMNASIRNSQGGAAGTLIAGVGSMSVNGELTHSNGPIAMVGGVANYQFQWTAPDQHGSYVFYGAGNAVNNNNNEAGDFWNVTGAVNITVQGATITAPANGTQLCAGSNLTITWTQTGLGNLRIELSSNNFANLEIISTSVAATAGTLTYTVPTTQAGATSYQVRLVESSTGTVLSTSPGFTISAGPSIVTQPASIGVCEGRAMTLTIGATGSSLIYRWRKNGNDFAGGTTATLNLPVSTLADAGTYDCVITGCNVNVTSNQAVVTITTKPSITTQPLGIELCEGDSGSISIAATGAGISYQWLRNGEPVIGAVSTTLKFPSATIVDEGEYTCRVLGSCPPEAVSAKAVVKMVERPAVTTHPSNKNLTEGDSLVLNIVSAGNLLSYQWQKDGKDISGATDKSYKKLNVLRADSGSYKCIVTNKCSVAQSNAAVVKVAPKSGGGQLKLSVSDLNFGNRILCADADSVVTGLLMNEGGSPITLTSVSAEPPSSLTALGLTLPLSIPAGAKVNVTVKISPTQLGAFAGTIQFVSNGGNPTLSVDANITSPVSFQTDTVVVPSGLNGVARCNLTNPLACPTLVVNAITLTGPGASTYKISPTPTMPLTIMQGTTIDICVEALDTTGGNAVVTLEGAGYKSTFVVVRRVVSSVDEDVHTTLSDVTVSPNPMKEELNIRGEGTQNIRVRIVDITGSDVVSLQGLGEVRWDGRNATGSRVAPGLYVAVVERGFSSKFFKVIVQ